MVYKGYKCLCLKFGKVIVSQYVVFDDKSFPFWEVPAAPVTIALPVKSFDSIASTIQTLSPSTLSLQVVVIHQNSKCDNVTGHECFASALLPTS